MGGVGSGAGISYWASRSLLADELAVIRAKAAARIQPQAEGGGGGPLLGDIAYSPQAPSQVARSAGGGGRYGGGRGTEGGTGEGEEMQDTYESFTAGVPRRDV